MARSNKVIVHQCAVLGPGVLEKRIGLAPQTQLQALLAEGAVQRLLYNAGFLLQ